MTRYLLDTNVVSETAKRAMTPAVVNWFGNHADDDLFIATLTIAEIWRGIEELPAGRKRRELEEWFSGVRGPRAFFEGRVLAFDESSALEWGRIIAQGRRAGRPRSPLDMIIAATALAHDCVVVTANERHFAGVVEFLDPTAET